MVITNGIVLPNLYKRLNNEDLEIYLMEINNIFLAFIFIFS